MKRTNGMTQHVREYLALRRALVSNSASLGNNSWALHISRTARRAENL